MSILLDSLKKIIVGLSLLACSSAFAGSLTVNLNNVNSIGEFGDPDNTILLLDVGANSHITSVSYDINLSAFSPSYLSEIGLAFTNSKVTEGVMLTPDIFDTLPGTASYADALDLVSLGRRRRHPAPGILRRFR